LPIVEARPAVVRCRPGALSHHVALDAAGVRSLLRRVVGEEEGMSDLRPEDLVETPTLEVRAYRDGVLMRRELCESEEDAAAFVDAWEQEPGIRCEVDDLSLRSHDTESFEVEPTDADEYPTDVTGPSW
jgi:hypothetical protein